MIDTESLMNDLNDRFQGALEFGPVKFAISSAIYLNPVAIAPQLWAALHAPNVEAISLWMWVIFATIQTAFIFEGIRVKSSSTFFSMLISVVESLTIIAIVLIRG